MLQKPVCRSSAGTLAAPAVSMTISFQPAPAPFCLNNFDFYQNKSSPIHNPRPYLLYHSPVTNLSLPFGTASSCSSLTPQPPPPPTHSHSLTFHHSYPSYTQTKCIKFFFLVPCFHPCIIYLLL